MVNFIVFFQATQNFHGIGNRGFFHIDFLETPGQCTVFFKDATEFLISCRTHAFQFTGGKHRLDQVGSIHHPTRGRTGTDNGVDFVDKQNRTGIIGQLLEHAFQTFFKITTVFGASYQCTQIERVDGRAMQNFRHFVVHDHLCQAFGNRGFTHTGFTHQQRVILATSTQNLHCTFHFVFTTNQRINLVLQCFHIEIGGVLIQRRAVGFGSFLVLHLGFHRAVFFRHLGNTMGHIVNNIQTINVLLMQQVNCLGFLFAVDGHQYIGTGDFFFTRGLHMKNRAL